MIITAELSLYPLQDGPIPEIKRFIHDLRTCEGIEIVTNQLSTQLRGEFEAVTAAINQCMRRVMESDNTLVLVAKYLNVDLAIGRAPDLD
ncbi:MAG TPA: hypothetical protein VKN35_15620 [Xanthomonadales bacterium]|nr:hypothetical protein [Xanthomonadales bacterium]